MSTFKAVVEIRSKSPFSTIEMWYLHAPDRTTPYEVTLKAIDQLYKEGKFKRFGISNFMSYVVLICYIDGDLDALG